jgi:hypothetical protein
MELYLPFFFLKPNLTPRHVCLGVKTCMFILCDSLTRPIKKVNSTRKFYQNKCIDRKLWALILSTVKKLFLLILSRFSRIHVHVHGLTVPFACMKRLGLAFKFGLKFLVGGSVPIILISLVDQAIGTWLRGRCLLQQTLERGTPPPSKIYQKRTSENAGNQAPEAQKCSEAHTHPTDSHFCNLNYFHAFYIFTIKFFVQFPNFPIRCKLIASWVQINYVTQR